LQSSQFRKAGYGTSSDVARDAFALEDPSGLVAELSLDAMLRDVLDVLEA